jgi:hypothetical protein
MERNALRAEPVVRGDGRACRDGWAVTHCCGGAEVLVRNERWLERANERQSTAEPAIRLAPSRPTFHQPSDNPGAQPECLRAYEARGSRSRGTS